MTAILIPVHRRWAAPYGIRWSSYHAPRRLRRGSMVPRAVFRCGRTGHQMNHSTLSCLRCGAVFDRGNTVKWVKIL